MLIIISGLYIMINLYTIRPTVVKSVDIETIKQKKNSDVDSNDNINPYEVIIDK